MSFFRWWVLVLGCDFASPIPPDRVKAAGYGFVFRYVAPPDERFDWKRLSKSEAEGLLGAGLGLGLFWESYASRPLEGFGAGVEDGRDAVAELRRLGAPRSVPLAVAVDGDYPPGSVVPYFEGWRSVGVAALLGVYGSAAVCETLLQRGLVGFAVQAAPPGWLRNNRVSPVCHFYQRLSPSLRIEGGWRWDELVMLREVGLWRAAAGRRSGQPAAPPKAEAGSEAGSGVFRFEVRVGGVAVPVEWPIMRIGMSKNPVPAVFKWQGILNGFGYRVACDGVFGPQTEEATRALQKRLGVAVDGVVGPRTVEAALSR
ncbi:MAG: DUF1906 domain-containing protein [Nevskia sp.]|nr:DUF1906 domain-containing protein [Nevskia sp.]